MIPDYVICVWPHPGGVQQSWWQQFEGVVCLDDPGGGGRGEELEELVHLLWALVPDHHHVDEGRPVIERPLGRLTLQVHPGQNVPDHLLSLILHICGTEI